MPEMVLLLDDQENIRRDLGSQLQKRGYGVHTASSIEEAKKIVLSEKIDYAIVDLKIDYRDEFGGTEFVNFVKRIQPRAKAIVLSAYFLDSEIRAGFEVEIDGYIPKGSPENYIVSVLKKLDELHARKETKTCFVIMPFSASSSCSEREWTEIFEKVIKPAVEESGYSYRCVRSQVLMGNIIEDIVDRLNRSEIVVADLTDRNPNVFYELGVRHALRGSTILIAQRIDDIPFDLRPYAAQLYDWKLEQDRENFKRRIKEIIELIEKEPEKAISPVRRYLEI